MVKRLAVCLFLLLGVSGCRGGGPTNATALWPGANGFHVAAWLVPYDARSAQSFSNNFSALDEINPVWYNLNPLYFTARSAPFVTNPGYQESILTLARNHGVSVLPTIQNWGVRNFDPAIISKIIHDPGYRAKHVAEIVALVAEKGYDGIDIDYEGLPASARQSFTAFIHELGTALHRRQKLLSVAVYAKTAEASWDGAGAQDWAALAGHADLLKVMVYDYHWAGFHAGPLAPVDWLEAVLEYAADIPALRQKLVVGLPFYGLKWRSDGSASEVMYRDALQLMADHAIDGASRSDSGHIDPACRGYFQNVEPHFSFADGEGDVTVYYQDQIALLKRLEVIRRYRHLVRGITFWRLGGEDPASWTQIRQFKAGA